LTYAAKALIIVRFLSYGYPAVKNEKRNRAIETDAVDEGTVLMQPRANVRSGRLFR